MRVLNKKFWPYKITLEGPSTRSMEIWLENNIGIPRQDWVFVEGRDNTDYYFIHPHDMLLFSLRWQ